MPTKREIAKKKYIDKVRNPITVMEMCDKMSKYLGVKITAKSPPIQNWIKFASLADVYFDKHHWNMSKAYMVPPVRRVTEVFEHPEILET